VGGNIAAEAKQHGHRGPARPRKGMDKHGDHTEVLAENFATAAQGGEKKAVGVRRGPVRDRRESRGRRDGGRQRREVQKQSKCE